MTRFAQRMITVDCDTASDLVQEAFLRLWKARATLQQDSCLGSLLFRIVRNLCLDHVRSARNILPLDTVSGRQCEAPGSIERETESRALGEAVRQAVQRLPESQRVVFILSQYEQMRYAEIAAILDCPVGTVASRKRLAVETLRRRLSGWIEGDR